MTQDRSQRESAADPVIVGLACLAVVVLLYRGVLHLGFAGDDLSYFFGDPDWLRHALLPLPHVWHYRPLNEVLLHVLGVLLGMRPQAMHAVNLMVHAACGIGLHYLLRRLGAERSVSLIAPLLFVSRGIGYEAVTWISTLSYLTTTAYALVSLVCWDYRLRRGGRRYAVGAVVVFAAALLTIEHAILLAPLYLLLDLLLQREHSLLRPEKPSDERSPWQTLARGVRRYLPFAILIGIFLAVKYSTQHGLLMSSLAGPSAPPAAIPSGKDVLYRLSAERTWHGVLNTPWRAYQDLLIGATYLYLPSGLASAAEDTWLTRNAWWCLLPFLALHLYILWKGRPLTRFLLGWVYIYVLPMSVAGVPQARFYYMAMAPAAALVGIAWTGTCRRIGGGRWTRGATLASVVALAAVLLGEARFIAARNQEWSQASMLVQQAIVQIQSDASRETRTIRLVNFPARVPSRFWLAPAFENAAGVLNHALLPPRPDLRIDLVYDRTLVGKSWPTEGRYLAREAIEQDRHRTDLLTYEFLDSPPHVTRRR